MSELVTRKPLRRAHFRPANYSLLDRKGEEEEMSAASDPERPSSSNAGGFSNQDSDEMSEPRLWEDVYESLIVLCLFSAFGVFLVCLPFLPKAHHSSEDAVHIVRTVVILTFSLFALTAIIYLLYNRKNLHYRGLILWPHRCQKCYQLFKDFHKYREVPSTSKVCDDFRTELSIPMNKSPLYLTCIFSTIVIGYYIFNFSALLACAFLDESQDSFGPTDIVGGTIDDLVLIVATYIVSFRFIPMFYDAHLVGLPKLRWLMVLIAGVSIWIAVFKLTQPFTQLTGTKDPTVFSFPSNCTLTDVMHGATHIAEPFSVELPCIIACFVIELWTHVLPYYDTIASENRSLENCQHCHEDRKLTTGFSAVSFWKCCGTTCKDIPEKQPLLWAKCHPKYQSISFTELAEKENKKPNYKDPLRLKTESMDNHYSSINQASKKYVKSSEMGRNKSNRRLSKRLKIFLAMTVVASGLYFGISNVLLTTEVSGSFLDPTTGRYLQVGLRMVAFTPELFLILHHKRMTSKHGGSRTRQVDSVGGQMNDNFFLVLLTGAALFDLICLVSSMGDIIYNPSQSTSNIILHSISFVCSAFGLIRIGMEAVFLLCVHHQQLENQFEWEWTLLCLSYIGMVNVTQWLLDSLIHKVTSPLAFPDLVEFFDGQVGEVLGVVIVPFFNLYELYVAIYAYEVYTMLRAL